MKKRLFVLPFALLILIMAVAFPASADTPSSIRVYLRRLQVEDTLRVTVKGQYATQDGRLSFSDGAKLVVVLRGDQLVLHTGQTAVVMGSSIKLVRCQSETPGYLLLNDGTGMYEGDLSLDIVENAIRPILTINVEDYLLGVVPFEMGDSFPLEALKAQAVTARTYALRKSGSSGAYDVEDTTNDQAYRGRAGCDGNERALRRLSRRVGLVFLFRQQRRPNRTRPACLANGRPGRLRLHGYARRPV